MYIDATYIIISPKSLWVKLALWSMVLLPKQGRYYQNKGPCKAELRCVPNSGNVNG
jgi:hypothetical protein